MAYFMTTDDFKKIAADALHIACKSIQDDIGDDGNASLFFSGDVADDIEKIFAEAAEQKYQELFCGQTAADDDLNEIILQSCEGGQPISLREWIDVNTKASAMQITVSELVKVCNLTVGGHVLLTGRNDKVTRIA